MQVSTQRSEKAQCSHKTWEQQIPSRMDKYRTETGSKPALIPHDRASQTQINKEDNSCKTLKLGTLFNFNEPNHEKKA